MDIERAKKFANKLNWSHFDMSEDSSKEYIDAVQTVLSELEKKDKVINEMAEWMARGNKYIYATVEDVKEDFYNKVEREGK